MRYFLFILSLTILMWACSNAPQNSGIVNGKSIFMSKCITCHGANGRMGLNGAVALPDSDLTLSQRMIVVDKGRKIMPAFNAILSQEEIEAVSKYTLTLK